MAPALIHTNWLWRFFFKPGVFLGDTPEHRKIGGNLWITTLVPFALNWGRHRGSTLFQPFRLLN